MKFPHALKSTLALAALTGLASAAHAALPTQSDMHKAPSVKVSCGKSFIEARVDRVKHGVASFTTVTGKKGAMPSASVGAETPGAIVCLPLSDASR